ncbi:MAG: hypothetical protein JWO02_2296 [Solirubrobacterales bacterium]|nr:hypothetical protein [Solirubrobacterales bacterium]
MRPALLFAGIAALAGAAALPGDGLAWHMAEHLMIGVVAPILIAAGAPVRTALAYIDPRAGRRLARLLHHPVMRTAVRPAMAFPASITVLLGVHLTPAFSAALHHPLLHALEHGALFWTGLAAWTGLLGIDPVGRPCGAIARLAWLTASMGAMAAVGATYLASTHVLFPHGTRSLADQQFAGTVMWLAAMAILVPAGLAAVVHALWREERRQRRREQAGAR